MERTLSWSFKQPTESTLGYTETLMYGHYSTHKLRHFARNEAENARNTKRISVLSQKSHYSSCASDCCAGSCCWWRHHLFGRTAQDWIFLTILGFSVALFSFLIDLVVDRCSLVHSWLYREAEYSIVAQYFAWILFPVLLIWFSTGFTHLVGPTAIGSGIPEVKTILKGVVLKEYLTVKTLIAKVVGLSASLGSGLPLGKVGPFVHVASVTASVLSKLFPSFKNQLENESLNIDILTAASAVGVSCTFAAPIGGVLFSIEATATYFAVRNYWRGFYSAMCGAIMFRLLASWFKAEETLTTLFKTSLRQNLPYDVFELISFIAVGILCGVFGALFVYTHKNIVLFIRRQKKLSAFLQKTRFLYSGVVTVVIFSVLFPAGFGKYLAGGLSLREAINQMFDNRTWSTMDPVDLEEARMLQVWKGPLDNIFLTIFLFFGMRFWMCAIATTLPVPCGIFIPAFGLGASVGRLIGELMAAWFPMGIRGKAIIPGAYAIVGAATFSGAVTHTVSPAVIVFELTGHLGHILPCVIAVMVAGATANLLQPSAYDAMIQIKKLPFLPPTINPDKCDAHIVNAEEIMVTQIHCLTLSSTYGDLIQLINEHKFRAFPLVHSRETMILLGSIQRKELKEMLFRQFDFLSDEAALCLTTPLDEVDDNQNIDLRQTFPPLKMMPNQKLIEVRRTSGSRHSFSISRVPDEDVSSKFSRKSSLVQETQLNQKKLLLNWEQIQLTQTINYEDCYVDPAPFQITSKTSLYKIHWLFSLLSLHHAYVVEGGRLVGVLQLAEVRKAIQCEVNTFPAPSKKKKHWFSCKKQEQPEVDKIETEAKGTNGVPI